jgi:hypothetical protein
MLTPEFGPAQAMAQRRKESAQEGKSATTGGIGPADQHAQDRESVFTLVSCSDRSHFLM